MDVPKQYCRRFRRRHHKGDYRADHGGERDVWRDRAVDAQCERCSYGALVERESDERLALELDTALWAGPANERRYAVDDVRQLCIICWQTCVLLPGRGSVV